VVASSEIGWPIASSARIAEEPLGPWFQLADLHPKLLPMIASSEESRWRQLETELFGLLALLRRESCSIQDAALGFERRSG